jgi:hypothetical protein
VHRYLAPVGGYTRSVSHAIDHVECVDEDEQRRQTAEAHRRWRRELQRDRGTCRVSILAAPEGFATNRLDSRLVGDLREIRRQVARRSRPRPVTVVLRVVAALVLTLRREERTAGCAE